MDFTAHNIILADGSMTMSAETPLVANGEWMRATARILDLLYQNGATGKSIVDLGCLEGGYTVEFARRGMLSKGIEVRQVNYENCLLVKKLVPSLDVTFEHDDVWNIGKYGLFDVVFCCGILYHLDRPMEFLKLAGEHARAALIINTHFAPSQDSTVFSLSPLAINEGFTGRWYAEHDSDDKDQLEAYKWSSWTNKNSFWLTRESILQGLRNGGFDLVFEQVDFLGENIFEAMKSGDYANVHRGMFVGIKTANLKS